MTQYAGFGTVIALLAALIVPAAAQQPPRTYTIELDVEKNYFTDTKVQAVAVSRTSGRVPVASFGVSVRQRIAIEVPADTTEIVFTAENGVTARVRLPQPTGTILIRPLGKPSSFTDLRWAFGSRSGIAFDRFYTEFDPK